MQASYDLVRQLWKEKPMETEADLNAALQHFRILFAYHSGKMENADITFHDTREIFDRGRVSGFTGDPRALFEQQNQKLCHAWLLPTCFGKSMNGRVIPPCLLRPICMPGLNTSILLQMAMDGLGVR